MFPPSPERLELHDKIPHGGDLSATGLVYARENFEAQFPGRLSSHSPVPRAFMAPGGSWEPPALHNVRKVSDHGRLRPSWRLISSQMVAMAARWRIGGSRGHRSLGFAISRTRAGLVRPFLRATLRRNRSRVSGLGSPSTLAQ